MPLVEVLLAQSEGGGDTCLGCLSPTRGFPPTANPNPNIDANSNNCSLNVYCEPGTTSELDLNSVVILPIALAQKVMSLPAMQETWIRSLCQEDPLGERNGNPLQYSCLENPMDRGAWWATVHKAAKSWT